MVNLGTVQQALKERKTEIKKTERKKQKQKKNFRIDKSAQIFGGTCCYIDFE